MRIFKCHNFFSESWILNKSRIIVRVVSHNPVPPDINTNAKQFSNKYQLESTSKRPTMPPPKTVKTVKKQGKPKEPPKKEKIIYPGKNPKL